MPDAFENIFDWGVNHIYVCKRRLKIIPNFKLRMIGLDSLCQQILQGRMISQLNRIILLYSSNFDQRLKTAMENPAILYLYLYVALSDRDFSQTEVDLILQKLMKNPAYKGINTKEFIQDVYQNFMRLPFDSVLMYLENYISEVKLNDSERISVIHDLEEIMEADGIIKKEELQAFQRIKKYLTIDVSSPIKASS